ncbi:hypothetical protein H5J25_16075 [Sphingomonas aliaeris]|jgi:hypothetical protein|uniref:Uncharacterized protein n=1 Tax=Sphingomonas aliaeris TaxID=2759526 RepID=A0A974S3U2_9SPHN|nr:hypothetical protein [Sphingomonas aliaeris]QQV76887.1 hypothetical protein H5J25_16075 [Sphingomonas aliaeris]
MIRGILGSLIGAEIDRRNGDSGLKGAAIGMIASRVLTRMGPLGLALGGAYVAKKAYDRHRESRRTV